MHYTLILVAYLSVLNPSVNSTSEKMQRWIGRVALVTGASKGIGHAICKELVKHSMVVVCAGSAWDMDELANSFSRFDVMMHPIICDFTKEFQVNAMFKEIRSKYGQLDVCINNCGIKTKSPLLSGTTEDWRRIFEVNVLGLCICTREAVKMMSEKNVDEGQIINMSSIAAHKYPETYEGSGINFYCGTKFMVRALTEGLRQELKNKNVHIRVSNLSAGLVETDLFNGTLDSETVKKLYSTKSYLEPEDIAESVISILEQPSHVDVNDMIVQIVKKTSG